MKVLIATKNQGKIEGATRALKNYFDKIEIIGIPVESNVSEQPVNDEIYNGAKNRVQNLKKYAKENNIVADLYLSIESGINDSLGRWMITNIAVIEDNNNFESYGTSPSFPVPDRLVQDIIDTDLSQVINTIFEKDEERHNRGGGIQLLTHNKISRIDLTEMAFIMALTKIRGFAEQEIEKTMLLLLEEVGELAKSIRKNATSMSIDKSKINHYDTIESEVADVFIVLNSVCNKLGINLYKAVKDKEEENIKREWGK